MSEIFAELYRYVIFIVFSSDITYRLYEDDKFQNTDRKFNSEEVYT